MSDFAPERCHEPLLDNAPRALAYPPSGDLAVWRRTVDETSPVFSGAAEGDSNASGAFSAWRRAVEAKLRELLGAAPERVPLDVRIEWEEEAEGFTERRFVFTSEAQAETPCHLLIPKTGSAPYPVVICLQGHTSGAHISLGRAKFEGDEAMIQGGDRDFALQAVREGYAALTIEQRCFGERRDARHDDVKHVRNGCHHASMVALLLGRTMIGERVWDVQRAIDALETFPELDPARVGCMGNSGGGTITWFAACLEPRIRVAMPSCYVCSVRYSIGRIDHCADNYVPGLLRWFDLGDLACLIAPRPLIVVAGRADPIFPIHGVEEAFETIQHIYSAAGAPDNCRLIVGESGHRFYADASWPLFRELSHW